MELIDHKKPVVEDKEFIRQVEKEDLSKNVYSRVFAVRVTFVEVSFKQSDFHNCYFRNCRFIRCDFTGSNFKESNFSGTQFSECDFRYTKWEKTIIDEHFLESCLPSEENLARNLVRSLRVNFLQIGNYDAVNLAASIEVSLTGQHLFNAAYSRQAYYRGKDTYKGWNRVRYAGMHARWKILDLLWGNGESVFRVVATGLFGISVITAITFFSNPQLSIADIFSSTIAQFWGIQTTINFAAPAVVTLTIIRFILFGLFMAILVKRLSRR